MERAPLRPPQDGLLVPCTALCWSSSQSLFSGGFLGKAYVSRMKGSAAVRKAPHSGFHQTDDSCTLWGDEAIRCPGLLGKLAGVGDPGSLCPACRPWSDPIWGGGACGGTSVPARKAGGLPGSGTRRSCLLVGLAGQTRQSNSRAAVGETEKSWGGQSRWGLRSSFSGFGICQAFPGWVCHCLPRTWRHRCSPSDSHGPCSEMWGVCGSLPLLSGRTSACPSSLSLTAPSGLCSGPIHQLPAHCFPE